MRRASQCHDTVRQWLTRCAPAVVVAAITVILTGALAVRRIAPNLCERALDLCYRIHAAVLARCQAAALRGPFGNCRNRCGVSHYGRAAFVDGQREVDQRVARQGLARP